MVARALTRFMLRCNARGNPSLSSGQELHIFIKRLYTNNLSRVDPVQYEYINGSIRLIRYMRPKDSSSIINKRKG